jgi:DNA-binding NtrC family response regulator
VKAILIFTLEPSRHSSDCQFVRVLIVDDDAEICQTLKGILRQHGHIASAIRGTRFRSAMVQDYELLVTDLCVTGRGLGIIAEIHEIDPSLKILAISGGIDKDIMLRAAETLGASKSLPKPFTLQEFLCAVNELMPQIHLAYTPAKELPRATNP